MIPQRTVRTLAALALLFAASEARAQSPVRGVIPRIQQPLTVDGRLDDWRGAFSTPVNLGHADWANRAATFHYLWDENALYIGMESLDQTIFNKAPGPIYNGDGVEFYLDLREGAMLGNPEWTPGALHLFFTAASNGEIKPRIQIRGGIAAFKDVTTEGMSVAAVKTEHGYTLEFRLPWSKIPGFKPAPGREIGIDCELCSSDGGPRVDRCWTYSGVAAVGSPGVLGRVRLVETFAPTDAVAYSDVLLPYFISRSSPLQEPATLMVGLSPSVQTQVRKVEVLADGQALPFVVTRKLGPGWERAQVCLVGFLKPETIALEVRVLGEGGTLLARRMVPVR